MPPATRPRWSGKVLVQIGVDGARNMGGLVVGPARRRLLQAKAAVEYAKTRIRDTRSQCVRGD